MIYTSLNEIASFNPCSDGWKNILKGQRKTGPDYVLFPLTEAVGSNSIADVCWLLGERKKELQVCVKFARMCADSVKHLNNVYSRMAEAYADDAYTDTYAAEAAAYADVAAAAAAAAIDKQKELNKSFFIQCITEWNEDNNTQEIYAKLGAL